MGKVEIEKVFKNLKPKGRRTIQARIEENIYFALQELARNEKITISKLLDKILLESSEIRSFMKASNKARNRIFRMAKRYTQSEIEEFYSKNF